MRILFVNEHIRGQVSGEETFWSIMGDSLEGAATLELHTFSGNLETYIYKNAPDILVYNALLGAISVPRQTKKIVLLQDNFVAMDKVVPKTFKQRISDIVKGKNSFYKKGIRAQREAIFCADRVVCVSEDVRRSYGIDATVIPIGVDTDLFRPLDKKNIRKEYGIPEGATVKIFVGSTHPVKGFDLLLEEIKRTPEVFYIVVVKDAKLPRIPLSNIRIFSAIAQSELVKLYNCADEYIGRSRVETLWLAPIEALSCNVPVDVTSTGIFADWQPLNKAPRNEMLERGLDKQTMIRAWQKLVTDSI